MSKAPSPKNVLIVGAGLGGLAAGLALQTDGHTVTIIDSAPEFAEVSRPASAGRAGLTSIRLEQGFEYRPTVQDFCSDGVWIWRK